MYAPNKNQLMELFTTLGLLIGLPLIIWFSVFNSHYSMLLIGLAFAIGGRFVGHGLDILVDNSQNKNKKSKNKKKKS